LGERLPFHTDGKRLQTGYLDQTGKPNKIVVSPPCRGGGLSWPERRKVSSGGGESDVTTAQTKRMPKGKRKKRLVLGKEVRSSLTESGQGYDAAKRRGWGEGALDDLQGAGKKKAS